MIANRTRELLCRHQQESFIEDVVTNGSSLYIANIVLISLWCIPTAIMNSFVILIIYITPSLHTSPNTFICSLAFTDLASGLFAQPVYVVSRFAELKYDVNTFCWTWLVSRLLGSWLANTSLLTLAAISIDRVLAVRRALRYRSAVRTKRVVLVAVSLWILAGFFSLIRLLVNDVRMFLGLGSSLYLLCLVVLCVSYWITFRSLKSHQSQVNHHLRCCLPPTSSHKHRVTRYRRSASTMLFIVVLTLVCYTPYICMSILVLSTGRSVVERTGWAMIDSVLFLNSFLNPILYYWRVKDVRRAMLTFIVRPFQNSLRRTNYQIRVKRWSAPSGFPTKPAVKVKIPRRKCKSMPNVFDFGKQQSCEIQLRFYKRASLETYDTKL